MYSKCWFIDIYSPRHRFHFRTGSLHLWSVSGPRLWVEYIWGSMRKSPLSCNLNSNAVEEEAAPNRWNFKKANWLFFQAQCSSELTEEAVMSAKDPTSQFPDLLIQAADKAIPKTHFSMKLPKIPWFNDSCKKALKERKKAQRKFFF